MGGGGRGRGVLKCRVSGAMTVRGKTEGSLDHDEKMEGGRSMLGETFIPYCKYDVSDCASR